MQGVENRVQGAEGKTSPFFTIQVECDFVCYTDAACCGLQLSARRFCLLLPTPDSLLPASRCVFAEALAKVGRDAVLHDAAQEARQRGGNSYQNPKQGGEDEARNRYRFERDGDAMSLAEAKVHGEDMGDKFDAADHHGSEQEGGNRKRADADQEYVDGAGDLLAAPAVAAIGEMLVIVRPHGRGEAGYVITPS
jgi:hypothetical protein